jgi:hypothetical protein
MKKTIIILLLLGVTKLFSQDLFKAVDGEISFFSKTPVENIDAKNKTLKALLNSKNGEMAFIVTNNGFIFEKPLMGEHFNENYIESDKYKVSVFKGKIDDEIDYSKDGTHTVKATGTLDIHGVTKERTIEGNITIKDGQLMLTSEFEVKLADHKIKIPKIVTENIAETVKVTVKIKMEIKK